ncbi:MAG: hypothetical protein V3T77_07190, partial [Planctomycetota bacterium]
LKQGWVDCENWDWFSVRQGDHLKGLYGLPQGRMEAETAPNTERVEHRVIALDMLRENLGAGDALAAYRVYRNTTQETGEWFLEEADLRQLIGGLFAAKAWDPCATLMAGYVKRFPGMGPSIRLRYAAILLKRAERPNQALKLLGTVSASCLSAREQKLRNTLVTEARKRAAASP